MVEPQQGQQLSLICDSAFNSLKATTTTLEMGLHVFGCEKCGRGCYPIEIMKGFGDDDSMAPGSHIVMAAKVKPIPTTNE